MFGKGANNLWTTISIQLFGIVFLFILANVAGHLLFKVSKNDLDSLYVDMRTNKLSSIIIASVIIFAIGVVASNFILKPYIYNWISAHVGIIPLN
jgi:multisubunit Na+/H+ antiporter MnhG subunit